MIIFNLISCLFNIRKIREIKMKQIIQFIKNEKAATAVEYALMIALIALVVVGAVTFLGTQTEIPFSMLGSQLNN